jgi:hypothetical protein
MIAVRMLGDNANGSATPALNAVLFQRIYSGGTDTGTNFNLVIPMTNMGIVQGYYPVYAGTQLVKMYLDEGKGLAASTDVTTTGTSKGKLEVDVFGYLVDK